MASGLRRCLGFGLLDLFRDVVEHLCQARRGFCRRRSFDETVERRTIETQLLHQSVEHRRLRPIGQRGADRIGGEIARAIAARWRARLGSAIGQTIDLHDLDAVDRLHRLRTFANDFGQHLEQCHLGLQADLA